jgi:hypothetical protein
MVELESMLVSGSRTESINTQLLQTNSVFGYSLRKEQPIVGCFFISGYSLMYYIPTRESHYQIESLHFFLDTMRVFDSISKEWYELRIKDDFFQYRSITGFLWSNFILGPIEKQQLMELYVEHTLLR